MYFYMKLASLMALICFEWNIENLFFSTAHIQYSFNWAYIEKMSAHEGLLHA